MYQNASYTTHVRCCFNSQLNLKYEKFNQNVNIVIFRINFFFFFSLLISFGLTLVSFQNDFRKDRHFVIIVCMRMYAWVFFLCCCCCYCWSNKHHSLSTLKTPKNIISTKPLNKKLAAIKLFEAKEVWNKYLIWIIKKVESKAK